MTQQTEREELLLDFNTYARQFTYRGHEAEPKHFPLGFPWFEAGYKAQAQRIAELKSYVKSLDAEALRLAQDITEAKGIAVNVMAERDTLRKELEAIKSQEPVGEVDGHNVKWVSWKTGDYKKDIDGCKLYTAPVAPAKPVYDPIGTWNKGFEEGKRIAEQGQKLTPEQTENVDLTPALWASMLKGAQ